MEIDLFLSPCIKLKSKWLKDLNIKPTTLNNMEDKLGSTLQSIGTGVHFLNITPVAQTLKALINKWDLLKLKRFCKAMDTVNNIKHQPIE